MRLRLYLDTSVMSARVDDRLPERQPATLDFWERLSAYEVSVSELTFTEARAAADPTLRERLLALVVDFQVLPVERPLSSCPGNTCAMEYFPRQRLWTRSTWRSLSLRGKISW